MALILYLENAEGVETPVHVLPEDDFQTFLLRAKSVIGQDIDISCVVGDKNVSLDDNIYQFMLQTAFCEKENNVPVENDITDMPQESLIVDNQNSQIDSYDENFHAGYKHLIYMLEDGTQVAYKVYEDANISEIEDLQQIDEKVNSSSSSDSNKTNQVNDICDSRNTEENKAIENNIHVSKEKTVHKVSKPCSDLEKSNKYKLSLSDKMEEYRRNENTKKCTSKSTKCSFCSSNINPSIFISYIFDDKDQKEQKRNKNKKYRNESKIICDVCLNNNFIKIEKVHKKLEKNEYLVVRNNIQTIYKKMVDVVDNIIEVDSSFPRLLNKINSERDKQKHIMSGDNAMNLLGTKQDNLELSNEKVNKDETDLNIKLYCCRLCGLVFDQLPILHSLDHIPSTVDGTVFPCVLCQYGFTSYQELSDHMHADHLSIKIENTLGVIDYSNSKKCSKEIKTKVTTKSLYTLQKQPPNKDHTKDIEEYTIVSKNSTDSQNTSSKVFEMSVNNDLAMLFCTKDSGKPESTQLPKKGLKLLEKLLKKQKDIYFSEEWLDHNTGVIVKSQVNENVIDYINDELSVSHKDSESDSDSGVWIVQAGDVESENKATSTVKKDVNGCIENNVITGRSHQCTFCKKRYCSMERLARHLCYTKPSKNKLKIATINPSIQNNATEKPEIQDTENNNCSNNEEMKCEGLDDGGKESNDAKTKGQHSCNVCHKSFHTKIRLQFHMRYIHCDSSTDPILRCSACPDLTFDSEVKLYDHIHFSHPKVNKFTCPISGCTKEFHLKSSLTTHLRCHTGERSHRCEECGKLFLDRQTLTEHHVTHLKVKPFQCHICLKYLNRKSRLRMHLLTHQSQPISARLLACKRCYSAFSDAASAEDHVNELGECIEKFYTKPQNGNEESRATDEKQNLSDSGVELSDIHNQNKTDIIKADEKNNYKSYLFEEPETNDFELDCEMKSKSFELTDLMKPTNRQCRLSQVMSLTTGEENEKTKEEMLQKLSPNASNVITVVEIDKVYRCEYCERVYWSQNALNLHRGSHQGQKNPFVCHVCGATFSTYSRCTTHKTTHGFFRSRTTKLPPGETLVAPPNRDVFPVVKYFLCEVCGKSYLHWTYLQVHRRLKHSDNVHMYKCVTCGDEFPNSWGVAYHRKKVHGQISGSAPPDEVPVLTPERLHYSCPDCGISVKTKAQLFLHRRSAHPPSTTPSKPGLYSCTQCNKRYVTKVTLRGHIKKQHEKSSQDKNHNCTQCGKTFLHANGLNTHNRRVHMKEVNYACTHCSKTFYSACDLQSHTRRHTGERPFPCDVCGKFFRTRGMRNEHLRIHSGERPYPCDICGLAFRRSYALRSHRLIHNAASRRLACPICPRVFRLKAELNTHMRHSHGVEPHTWTLENSSNDKSHINTDQNNKNDNANVHNRNGGIIIFHGKGNQSAKEPNILQEPAVSHETNVKNDKNHGINEQDLMAQNDVEIFTAIFDESRNNFGDEIAIEMTDTVFLHDHNGHLIIPEGSISNGHILLHSQNIISNGEILLHSPNPTTTVSGDQLQNQCSIFNRQFVTIQDSNLVTNNQIILHDQNMASNDRFILSEDDEVIGEVSEESGNVIINSQNGNEMILGINDLKHFRVLEDRSLFTIEADDIVLNDSKLVNINDDNINDLKVVDVGGETEHKMGNNLKLVNLNNINEMKIIDGACDEINVSDGNIHSDLHVDDDGIETSNVFVIDWQESESRNESQ